MWLLFALGAAVFAGITSILAKIGMQDTDSDLATAMRTIVILIFSWILVFMTGAQSGISTIDNKSLCFLILSGFATGGSWLCYFRAIHLGSINKVIPIDKSSTILSMLLAFVILQETISMYGVLAIISIGIGTFLMIQKNPAVTTKPTNTKWFPYAVLAAIFAALTSILGKIGIENVDSNLGTAIRTIVVLVMAWVIVCIQKKQTKIRTISLKSSFFIILSGLSTGLSWLCYYRALQDGPASVVVPIDKLSIVITIAFSYFVLHEKLSKKAMLGLSLICIGTLLLLI